MIPNKDSVKAENPVRIVFLRVATRWNRERIKPLNS